MGALGWGWEVEGTHLFSDTVVLDLLAVTWTFYFKEHLDETTEMI